jgi:hypothetical protein
VKVHPYVTDGPVVDLSAHRLLVDLLAQAGEFGEVFTEDGDELESDTEQEQPAETSRRPQ